MKQLHRTGAYRPAKLMDELLVAIPALRPVNGDAQTFMSYGVGEIWLTVPDEASEAEIDAVLATHDPTPPPPVPAPDYGDGSDVADLQSQAAQAVSNLRAYRALSSPTNAQTLTVVKLLCAVAIHYIRSRSG